jgi:uncharacterized membrane protein
MLITTSRFTTAATALLLFIGSAVLSFAESNYMTLDVPGSSATGAAAINDQGDILGPFTDAKGTHSFLLSKGRFSTVAINLPAGQPFYGAWSTGLDPQDNIVGGYATTIGSRGFLISRGVLGSLDFPGGYYDTFPLAINSGDEIVGYYCHTQAMPPDICHGFLLAKHTYTSIDAPGGAYGTFAAGISPQGDIVGGYTSSTGSHGFLLSRGKFTNIDFPGAKGTSPSGINSEGDVAGYYTTTSGTHAFLLSKGKFTTVDVPGSSSTSAYGINSQGDIVGTYTNATGNHGFLRRGQSGQGDSNHDSGPSHNSGHE